jgi:multicomponent Na+:H+ antiporter subunit G
MRDVATLLLLAGAAFFFLAGTIGVLRFPDAHARLHAVAKADNLGLGLLCAALALQADSVAVAAKIALVWALALAASAISSQLIAGATPWRDPRRREGRPDA